MLLIRSLHILEGSWRNWEYWFHWPIVHIKKQFIRNLRKWPSLANQQLFYNRCNSPVLGQRKIVCAQSQGLHCLKVICGNVSFFDCFCQHIINNYFYLRKQSSRSWSTRGLQCADKQASNNSTHFSMRATSY